MLFYELWYIDRFIAVKKYTRDDQDDPGNT